jgi:hypothetical protein
MFKMREVYLRFARPPVYNIHFNQANPRHPRPTQLLSSSYDVITARGGAPLPTILAKTSLLSITIA